MTNKPNIHFPSIRPLFLSAIASLLCIALLVEWGWLEINASVGAAVTIIGWFVAIGVALNQIQATYESSQKLKKEELKHSLQREAVIDIIVQCRYLISKLGDITAVGWDLSSRLNSSTQLPSASELHLKVIQATQSLLEGQSKTYQAIESHEIAVIQFQDLYRYIMQEIDYLHDMEQALASLILAESSDYSATVGTTVAIKYVKDFETINETIWTINAYLYDLRQILQNKFYGKLFDAEIPPRKPAIPHKTLSEIAVPGAVEQRTKAREELIAKRYQTLPKKPN